MFRVLILQTLYDLSDEAIEYNIGDRDSFKKFIGIGHADNIPDALTIWKFRERLGDTGTRELFDLFYAYMREKGLQCSKGKIIDATFQEARIQRNTPEENAHIKDTGKAPGVVKEESAQGCRSNVYQKRGSKVSRIQGTHYRGEKSKIIDNYETTTAKVHDSNVCAELLPEDAKKKKLEVLADSGYFGKKIRKSLHKKGVKAHIMQRRVKGQDELTHTQKCRYQRDVAALNTYLALSSSSVAMNFAESD